MMTQATPLPHDDYIMGRTSEEYRRLRRQAEAWEPATRRILQIVGLRRGMTCLDVGCGPGEVMRLMGTVVGRDGRVTGIDVDGALGREALENLAATGESRFGFIEGDILASGEIAEQQFDLTYARLVLLHAADPQAVLRKMYALTKPGGVMVVQDYYLEAVDLYPKLDAVEHFLHVFRAVFERGGRDTRIGFKLPNHFIAAGIGAPDGTDVAGALTSFGPFREAVEGVYRSLLPRAIAAGITSEAAAQEFFSAMHAAQISGRPYSGLWPLLIAAWKRKSA